MTAPPGLPAPPPRPLPPPLRLPRFQRRTSGTVVSIGLHAVILFLLLRHGQALLAGGGDRPGPRGGGGGGARAAVRYLDLPASSPPAAQVATAPAEPPVPTVLPVPDPVRLDDPPLKLAVAAHPAIAVATASTAGAGSDGGQGAGPGSGGGIGGGAGTGVGNDSGPGRGRGGEYISPPYARTVLLAPECAHGRFTVQFWVEADGNVSRVAIDPLPKESGCRRDMRDKMMGYRFLPARTRDGRAVASRFQVQFQQP